MADRSSGRCRAGLFDDCVRVAMTKEGPDVAAIRARLEALLKRAAKEPIDIDISDYNDEWCKGFLAGQVHILQNESADYNAEGIIESLLQALEAAEEFYSRKYAEWVDTATEGWDSARAAEARAEAAERRAERYEKALDGWFAPDTWRIADGSEVGVRDGALIQCGVRAALTKQEEEE